MGAFIGTKYGLSAPAPSAAATEYAAFLNTIAVPVFVCHFYNYYFAHTAGGRMIDQSVMDSVFGGHLFEFYKWDRDVKEILTEVKSKIDGIAEKWTREQKDASLDATPITFSKGGQGAGQDCQYSGRAVGDNKRGLPAVSHRFFGGVRGLREDFAQHGRARAAAQQRNGARGGAQTGHRLHRHQVRAVGARALRSGHRVRRVLEHHRGPRLRLPLLQLLLRPHRRRPHDRPIRHGLRVRRAPL